MPNLRQHRDGISSLVRKATSGGGREMQSFVIDSADGKQAMLLHASGLAAFPQTSFPPSPSNSLGVPRPSFDCASRAVQISWTVTRGACYAVAGVPNT